MESLGVVVGGHGCRLQVPDEEAPKQMPSPVNMGPWLGRGRVVESVRRSVTTCLFRHFLGVFKRSSPEVQKTHGQPCTLKRIAQSQCQRWFCLGPQSRDLKEA